MEVLDIRFARVKQLKLTVGDCRQSLGDIAGDGLPDEPGGGASCGAQHDVRGSELLGKPLGTAVGSGGSRLWTGLVGCWTGSWISTLPTSRLKQLQLFRGG